MVILKINDRSKEGKLMLAYLKTRPYIEVVEAETLDFIQDFKKSLEDVKNNNTKPLIELFNGSKG